MHARRLAEKHFHRQIHGLVVEVGIAQLQMMLLGRLTNHGIRAALATAQGIEQIQVFRRNRHHVTFLGFVTPDLQGRHPRLITGNIPELKLATTATVLDQLRHGIGQAASSHIVNKADRVFLAHLPATVDNFLTTAFHFRVIALYRGKIQILVTGTGVHGRGCAPTKTNQHGRATQHNQFGADRNIALLDVLLANVTQTTGNHDRLVIPTNLFTGSTRHFFFKGPEVTGQVRTTKFVVKRSTADGAFNHDIQRRGNPVRLAIANFPGLLITGNIQIGHGETGKTGFRLGTTTGRAFIPDFATRTCGRARERGNRCWVVVGLHFHQDVHRLPVIAVDTRVRIREEATGFAAGDHRGVVLVGRQHALAIHLEGIANHREQGLFLAFPINIPGRVENLVAAVLRVGLSEHHQLNIRRIPLQADKGFDQVVNLIVRQRQA